GVDAKTCKLIVLDQNIESMAQFKQIIGRGTRIREDYNKLYFTIMDFKGATRLFQDKKFDGDPVMIYEPKPEEPILPPDERSESEVPEASDSFVTYQDYEAALVREGDDDQGENRNRYYIDDVAVTNAIERSQYLDENGKLITEDYRVFLKEE